MSEAASRRLAVLIDAENMPAKHAEVIFDEVATFGDATVRRLYGDFGEGSVKPWLEKLTAHAITAVHEPKTSTGKNAADIALVIDALDLVHRSRIDGIVIVSSDGDFTRLARRLREEGLAVYGIGEKKTAPPFRQACKQFVAIENLTVQKDAQNEPVSTTTPQQLNHAFQRISNVLRDSNDEAGWAGLGWVGSQLLQRYPDFDSRSYGERRLSDLIGKIDRLERDGSGSSLRIRIKPSDA